LSQKVEDVKTRFNVDNILSAWRKMTRRQQKRNQAWLSLVLRKKAEWGKAAQGLRQNHLPRACNGEKRDLIEDQNLDHEDTKGKCRKKERKKRMIWQTTINTHALSQPALPRGVSS
jgi:hypothetical protein